MTKARTAGQCLAEDAALLGRATEWDQYPELRDCTLDKLSEVAREHGLDFATAVLHDRVLRHPVHSSFFQRMAEVAGPREIQPLLAGIVPGAFYLQHKNTGADGAPIAAILESLNCRCERVPVDSFGSLTRNASFISDWLARHAHERVMLVSLSKGSADLKRALAQPNAAKLFRNVVSWVSVSGLSQGTPLVAWLRQQPLRRLGVRLWLRLHGQRYSVVEELRHETGGPLTNWPTLPAHLRVIHITGLPLQRHLAHPWASRAYERLAPLGPNDGGGILLGSVATLPGMVFPVWGADHYLQPAWDVVPIFRRVLAGAMSADDEWRHASQSAIPPIKPPASRSTA